MNQRLSEDHANLSATDESVGRSAALMSVLVIISRVTGFMRTWGQAYALGVTAMASCYTVANNLPNQLYELVMGGMIMTAFLPVYLSVKQRVGREGANAYASNLITIVTLLMAIVTLASLIFADAIVWTQSFSAGEDFDAAQAVFLFRFFVIEIVLYALSSIVSGILNAERDYLWSTAAPIFNNIVCLASFVLYSHSLLVSHNPTEAMLFLALGNPLGVAVQVIVQLPSLRRNGVRLRPRLDWHDPALRETLSIGIPTLIVTITSYPTVAVQTSCALQVTAAGPSIAYYARLWYVLPYAVFAVPVTVALFTELSSYVESRDMESFKHGVLFGSNRIIFMLVPFALFLIVFAPQLIAILALGRFDGEGLAGTITYLRWLALALPFYGLNTYLQKICSALRKMNFFMVATVAAAVVQIGFCFAFTDIFGLAGVAFSSTLFFVSSDIVVYWYLRRELGALGLRSMLRSFVLACAFGAVGALVGVVLLPLVPQVLRMGEASVAASALCCVVAGVPAVAATYGLAYAVGISEVRAIVDPLARRVRRAH